MYATINYPNAKEMMKNNAAEMISFIGFNFLLLY